MKNSQNRNVGGSAEKDIHILIVEDNDLIALAMHEFISECGYRVTTLISAEQAIELMKYENVQLVITDIMLPGMDGLRLTEMVKKKYDANVIVMTGYSGDYSYEDAIEKGASDFIFKPVRLGEIMLRIRRVLKERELTAERDRILKKLEMLAITDDLTQLYNSRYFYKQLKLEIGRSLRYHHPVSLLFMDIDRFKSYNDTYGHLEGDRMLTEIARIVKTTLRQTDFVCRYGGDEFTAILPETEGKAAKIAAERIQSALAKGDFIHEIFRVSVSSGIAEYHPDEDIASFIQRADQAMFLSKQKGRNQITILHY